MIVCAYCGRQNEGAASHCVECGTEFTASDSSPVPRSPALPEPKLIKPETFTSAVSFEDGFHRIDWSIVRQWIETQLDSADWDEAWSESALWWASQLRDDLGGDYSVFLSDQTVLLCDQPGETARWLLDYSGRAANTIKDRLGPLAWRAAFGKDVVIVFSEQDDYYQYVAHHMADGENPSSGGMCLDSGYTHIAVLWNDQFNTANVIIHELAHNCLAHLPLPVWLNEGVAVTLEKAIGEPPRPLGQSEQAALYGTIGWRPLAMWDELAERHFAFWNEQNIQTFWAGTSFDIPGESNELSYSLAEVFVKLLTERGESQAFRGLLEASRQEDAGHSAALYIFKADLGEIAGTFLGAGDWRPQRKAIKACWEAAGWNLD